MYFLTVAKFEKMLESGMIKKVSEQYLVDAMSCTEAEARTCEEIQPFISGEFSVTSAKQMDYSEIFFSEDGDRFWECKVHFITLDEKSGAEKRLKHKFLVQATTLDEAKNNLDEGMKGTLSDYWVAGINETKIMDVFTVDLKDGVKKMEEKEASKEGFGV